VGAALSVADSERRETPPERRSVGEQLASAAAMMARMRTWKMRFLREHFDWFWGLGIYLFVSCGEITFGLELIVD